ncbi:alpha/beta-hydrolase [Lophium mytilinum]|uniref:Carboxylic ester hydrolase n=1 Tax=Lophium mytilinum TaxID=390894 RepID=A0A6A6QM65_9PEZI|nr:alpha/beta-hydrolase [Lophium mytilinum]
MVVTRALAFFVFPLCILSIALHPKTPIVDLGYASYSGYYNASVGINYFRGIPYAKSPTGELRWRKPVPIDSAVKNSKQLISASSPGPACYQGSPTWADFGATLSSQGSFAQSEDCLILDMLVPSNPVSHRLPVIVQIHGGGYTLGSAALFPGDAMVNQSSGTVIYVIIQYRLGVFGFLAGESIAKDGNLNAGLLDQRAALEWLKRHIHAFGGDPSRVTVWGGSAGGGSVSLQLTAYSGKGTPPFSAAIAEYPWWQPFLNPAIQEAQYDTTLRLSGCSDLNCLRSLSVADLANAGQAVLNVSYPSAGYGYGLFYFGPVVDGIFVRDLPSNEYREGHFYKVPTIVDHEGYEGVIFTNFTLTTTENETKDAQYIFPSADASFFSRLYELYPSSDFNSTFFQRQQWFGDAIINCPSYQIANGAATHSPNPHAIYKLVTAIGTELHSSNLPFLNSVDPGFTSAPNATVAKILTGYWLSFATTGSPNPRRYPGAPYWPSYVGAYGGKRILSINYTQIGTVPDPDEGPRCDFFSSEGTIVEN